MNTKYVIKVKTSDTGSVLFDWTERDCHGRLDDAKASLALWREKNDVDSFKCFPKCEFDIFKVTEKKMEL